MKKRATALLLTLVLCLGLLPLTALAAELDGPQITWLNLPEGYMPWHYIPEADYLVLGDADGEDGRNHPALDMKTGQLLDYDFVDSKVSDGLIRVGKDIGDSWSDGCTLFGYIDLQGNVVVPLEYDQADTFSDGLALVSKYDPKEDKEQKSFIDTSGKEVIHLEPECVAYAFHEGIALISRDKYGYIDKTSKVVVPFEYDSAEDASEGLAAVGKDGKWGFVDATGKVVIPLEYTRADSFSEGLAKVQRNGKFQFINRTGVVAFAPTADTVSAVSCGMVRGHVDKKVGFLDAAGKVAVPFQYTGASDFSEDLAAVMTGEDILHGKWGCVDKTGKVVVPIEYDWVGDFSDGLATVEKNGKYGLINKHGDIVIPTEYELYTRSIGGNRFAVGTGDNKWGIFEYDGEGASKPQPTVVPVTGVSVSKSKLELKEGKAATLTATVKPSNADNKGVYWVSSDTGVATVDRDTGVVTGVKQGTATVTVATLDGGFTASCAVTVTKVTSGGGGGSSSGGSGSSKPSGGGSSGGGSSNTTTQPTQTGKPASEQFSDVTKGSWYESGVTFVVNKGLFKGMSEKVFAPNTNMTRAMLMTVLARLDGQDTAGGDTWYAKAMDWAKANGISDGTMPQGNITREQMVTMLYRYAKAGNTRGDLSVFADGGSVSAWARDAMTWAVANGILTGKDGGRLDPQGTATRAEVATILQRFVEKR